MLALGRRTSVLAVRSLLRPAAGVNGNFEYEYRAARAIVERHGVDSLSPFVFRPDKAFHVHGEGMLAYRVIGETAIVSSDPVAPDGEAPQVLSGFLNLARERGWQVVLWGASARHLDAYRQLDLRAVCAGEEAFVDPSAFTLEGRRVRKLRQSVHRVERRGWQISACEGRELAASLESENRCGRGELASRQGAAYIAAGENRAIVVAPQGARNVNSDREYVNWGPQENWPAAISEDLPRCIDKRFRTIANRRGRALVGLSAGGFGSFNIALGHLETFAAVEPWSGYFAATDPTGLRTLDLGSEEANQDARVPRDDCLDTGLEVRPTFIGFYVGQQDSRFLTANILLDRGQLFAQRGRR